MKKNSIYNLEKFFSLWIWRKLEKTLLEIFMVFNINYYYFSIIYNSYI